MSLCFVRSLVVSAVAGATVLSGSLLAPASAAFTDRPSFAWAPNSTVFSMARSGNTVYIGGNFTSLRNPTTGQTVARSRLAALDANTGAVLAWNPGANNTVRALSVGSNGTVYAGGDFTTVAGGTATRLAALTAGGSRVAGWSASANRTVRQIRADGGSVYVAGNFGRVDNTSRIGVAKINAANGSLVTGWNARVRGGRVRALALGPSSILVGGSFTSLAGQSRQFLGSVSRDTGAVTSWRPSAVCGSCQVLDLDTTGNDVLGAVGGGGGGRAARWSGASGARQWVRGADGDVQAVAMGPDGIAYFGGHFGPTFFGQNRHQLVALNAGNGSLLPYRLDTTGGDSPGVWDLLAEPGQLYVGGNTRLSGTSMRGYLRFPTT